MTQGQPLAETMAATRDLVYFYMNKIAPEDWNKSLELNGKVLHTLSWQIAHLCRGENMLIMQGCSDKNAAKPWQQQNAYYHSPHPPLRRGEGTHIGQLSMLCKGFGVATI